MSSVSNKRPSFKEYVSKGGGMIIINNRDDAIDVVSLSVYVNRRNDKCTLNVTYQVEDEYDHIVCTLRNVEYDEITDTIKDEEMNDKYDCGVSIWLSTALKGTFDNVPRFT